MAQVTLVDHTQNPEEKIGLYASICYDSRTDPDACVSRARSCVDRGHLSTLRFASATFHIAGISRACSHQLVRSKHLDYLQESQRYVDQSEAEFVFPPTNSLDVRWLLDKELLRSKLVYEELIKLGLKKEDARYVLPNASTTRLYVTGNFQAWLDFINLRSGKEVQWEIREVAHEIKKQLSGIAPGIFGDRS